MTEPGGAVKAEMALLGAAFIDPTVAIPVIAGLPDGAFTDTLRAAVAFELGARNPETPVDRALLQTEIPEPIAALWVTSCGSPQRCDAYGETIRDAYDRRLVVSQLRTAVTAAEAAPTAAEAVTAAVGALDLPDRTGVSVSSHTAAEGFLDALDASMQRSETGGGSLPGIPTGFGEIDRLTGGMQPGQLWVVGARPSVGKTAFALNIAGKFPSDTRVLFVSLEMSATDLAGRMIAAKARVGGMTIRDGSVSSDQVRSLTDAADWVSGRHITFVDSGGVTLNDVRSAALQHRPHVIFVDYLQLMTVEGRMPREQAVASLSRGLKLLGRDLNLAVVALSQLRRDADGRRPGLPDLRESGAIEQDADVICALYRPEVHDPKDPAVRGLGEAIVLKNRGGPPGTQQCAYIADWTAWEPLGSDGPTALPRDDDF
jgi:replicative DNA helicase